MSALEVIRMSVIHLQLVDINTFHCNKMKQYTERQVIMISKIQAKSLSVLKSHNVNISQFIRQAIKEKISRDWKEIKEENNHETNSNIPDWAL